MMTKLSRKLKTESIYGKKITFEYADDGRVNAKYSNSNGTSHIVSGKTKRDALNKVRVVLKKDREHRQIGTQNRRGEKHDEKLRAKLPGRRVSKSGKRYYERRRNRSDTLDDIKKADEYIQKRGPHKRTRSKKANNNINKISNKDVKDYVEIEKGGKLIDVDASKGEFTYYDSNGLKTRGFFDNVKSWLNSLVKIGRDKYSFADWWIKRNNIDWQILKNSPFGGANLAIKRETDKAYLITNNAGTDLWIPKSALKKIR